MNPSTVQTQKKGLLNRLRTGVGFKIILPYFLLTLFVAAIGAYVVTTLVTNSLQERFNNQLVNAGRVVAETMVRMERDRLEVLRAVAATNGVPVALAAGDPVTLNALIPQIIANSKTDVVELLDQQGQEIYGWQQPPGPGTVIGETRSGADFATLADVRLVLAGREDQIGDKRALLLDTDQGPVLFTIGPVRLDDNLVGAVLVGTYIEEMLVELTETAVARVTLYDRQGRVIRTTHGGGQEGVDSLLQEDPGHYRIITTLLQTMPDYQVVVASAVDNVPLREVEILGQSYRLAYGDWRVRDQSFGLFSVALPSNFIVSTVSTSRNQLTLIFFIATLAVFGLGYFIAQRIVQPLNRLVQATMAIARGNLTQRTGIRRNDEIGSLAESFDEMTEQLEERNRLLVEQASKQEAILHSITDAVIVLDLDGVVIAQNPAAETVLADMSPQQFAGVLSDLTAGRSNIGGTGSTNGSTSPLPGTDDRYRIGAAVLSARSAAVRSPQGQDLGTVVVLRDVTRQAEAEALKDNFIATISHELRTPLTAVKGFSDLLVRTGETSLPDPQRRFAHLVNENTNRLMAHINKLIDISQIQAGTIALARKSLDFNTLIQTVAAEWRPKMAEKGLTFQLELPEDPLRVQGDEERLQWSIGNLLSNAYHYTPSEGTVTLTLGRDRDQAQLVVADTGIGIATTDQPYLFTQFFGANNQAAFDIRGVGLGLYITRSIVELHEGRVWAESRLNAGSRFFLSLPLAK